MRLLVLVHLTLATLMLSAEGREFCYSPFFLVRHAAPIFFLSLVATLLGIPLSYFLPRWSHKP